MKIKYKPSKEETKRKRKAEYLSKYPIEIQLEAITESAQGRPEKLNELLQGLAEIRESLPFSEEVE